MRENIYYSFLQIFYWGESAIVFVFSGLFLQSSGLSNSSIGILLALANIFSFILSNVIADYLDKHANIATNNIASQLLLLELIVSIVLIFTYKSHTFVTGFLYMLLITQMFTVGMLYNKLYADLSASEIYINYSLSRGLGSFSFAVVSVFMGWLIEKCSCVTVPYAAVFVILIQTVSLKLIGNIKRCLSAGALKINPNNMHSFLGKNPGFCILLIGIAFIFAAANVLNSFYYLIIENIGGNSSTLGNVKFFVSISELIMMFVYSRIKTGRISLLLKIGLVFFPIKLLAIYLSDSVSELYIANLLQGLSFGLYTPALVDWVIQVIPNTDSGKGQSLATSITQLGTFISTIVFGFLFDGKSVNTCLVLMVVISMIGVPLGMIGIRKQESLIQKST